jgi:hypothetical protein
MPAPSYRSWSLQRRSRRLAVWFVAGAATIMAAACGGTQTTLTDACGEPPQPALLFVSEGTDSNPEVAYTFSIVGTHPVSLIEVTAASIGTGSGSTAQSIEARDFFCFVPVDATRLGTAAFASFTLAGGVIATTNSMTAPLEAVVRHWFDDVRLVDERVDRNDMSEKTVDSTVLVPVTLGSWMSSSHSMDVRVGVSAGTQSSGRSALTITFNGVSAGGRAVSLAQVRTASGVSY